MEILLVLAIVPWIACVMLAASIMPENRMGLGVALGIFLGPLGVVVAALLRIAIDIEYLTVVQKSLKDSPQQTKPQVPNQQPSRPLQGPANRSSPHRRRLAILTMICAGRRSKTCGRQ